MRIRHDAIERARNAVAKKLDGGQIQTRADERVRQRTAIPGHGLPTQRQSGGQARGHGLRRIGPQSRLCNVVGGAKISRRQRDLFCRRWHDQPLVVSERRGITPQRRTVLDRGRHRDGWHGVVR